jgi:23S rRNA (cytidine1920-2'-O)/16S rRNA (cytidine1409-2'-O)-methyltransferase
VQTTKRLDVFITEKGLVASREKAQGLINTGYVLVNGLVITKTGYQVKEKDNVELKTKEESFVSRGGEKLLSAIKHFNIDVKNFICLDIGASTGGFTDCLLKHGARKVYALDVGYGQLDWNLRNDSRVVCIEKTNIRYWDWHEISDEINLVTIDVSFISLELVIPKIPEFLKYNHKILALIKPQFEVGQSKVGKNGVVREQKYRDEAIEKIKNLCINLGYNIIGINESGLKGPKGNVEYFIYMEK